MWSWIKSVVNKWERFFLSNRRVWRTFQDMKVTDWKIIFLIFSLQYILVRSSHTYKCFHACFRYGSHQRVLGEGSRCSSLIPKACSSLPLEVVDYVDEFGAEKLNLHLNTGCYTGDTKRLLAQLDNAPAPCNPPCFRIKKPGEYCYMSTRKPPE